MMVKSFVSGPVARADHARANGAGGSGHGRKTVRKSSRGGGPEDDPSDLRVPGLDTAIKDNDVKGTLDDIDAALSSNDD